MASITGVAAVPTVGGFYFDDKAANKQGAEEDGFAYRGETVTPGFDRVRQPAEAVSVQLQLEDGHVAVGECAAVQYSGSCGRDEAFNAEKHAEIIENTVADALLGREAENVLTNIEVMEELEDRTGTTLHRAVEYGLSQALFDGAAKTTRRTIAEVVSDEYDTEIADEPIDIYGQTGDDRYVNAEKMIIKEVDVLPHGLFNTMEKTGEDGEKLLEYVEWLSDRVQDLGSEGYHPRFHVDTYGTIGGVFDAPYDRAEVAEYFAELEAAADPFDLHVESPIEVDSSRADQIEALAELRDGLREHGVDVDVVADEWCNTLDDVKAFVDEDAADIAQIKTPDLGSITETIEAVQYCKDNGVEPFIGGTCAETDVSSRVCAQVALATQPLQIFAKPGMGFDEGFMIVNNEMKRALALVERPVEAPAMI
ncbi:MAG: methylaspartate ammonia-lyase [archaeon]